MASYGVSIVGILENIGRDITAPHCIWTLAMVQETYWENRFPFAAMAREELFSYECILCTIGLYATNKLRVFKI